MKIGRILSRILLKLLKFIIGFVCYFNHRLFMRLYIPLLKKYGVKFNGVPRYIGKDVIFDDFNKVTIGDRVVISNDCHLLTHDYSYTTALIALGEKPDTDIAISRGIVIGNNVFIGKKSIIMPNTIIGNDIIIGAGSVVRGKITDNSIVVGNPGQIIGKTTEQAIKWKNNIDPSFLRKDKS